VPAADGLDDALAALSAGRTSWLSVVQDGRLVGIRSVRDIVAAYRRALAGNIRQVRGLASGGVFLEAELAERSPLVGRRLADAGLPREVVLVAIERRGRLVVPHGDVVLAAGDRLSLFGAPEAEAAARAALALPPPLPSEAQP
jgi:hypothetical protein